MLSLVRSFLSQARETIFQPARHSRMDRIAATAAVVLVQNSFCLDTEGALDLRLAPVSQLSQGLVWDLD